MENLIEKMKAINPERSPLANAIDKLSEEGQMREFIKQYIEHLRQSSIQDPEMVAHQNIGYFIGYCGKDVQDRWMKVSEEIKHPLFGRDIPDKVQIFKTNSN